MKSKALQLAQKGNWTIKMKNGFSTVEALLASSILALIVTVFIGAYIYGSESTALAGQRARATFLAEEGLEAARNIRDASFANLSNGNKGLAISGNQWNFSGTSDVTDGFYTRQLTFSSIDSKRKQVISTVTWQQNGQRTGSVSLTSYLNNWRGTARGAAPSLIACFNLDVSNSGNESADGISVATAGSYLYLGRQNNNGYEFFVLDITTLPTPSLLGKLAVGDTVNDISISGNFAYLASSDNEGELTVVDITNPSAPTVATKFDLTVGNSGNANSNGLAVSISSNTLYLTRVASSGKEFYVFNISTPSAPTLTGSVDLNGDLKEIAVIGNYIYGASSDNTEEFQVINVSTPSSPTMDASLDLDQGATQPDALSITAGINTIYLGRDGSAAPEFYIIDVTTPTSPSITSTLNIGTHILQSMDYDDSSKFIFFANTAPGSEDYQVIDVSNSADLTLLNNVNLNGTPYKLVYSPSKDAVMIASGYDSCELQIISP